MRRTLLTASTFLLLAMVGPWVTAAGAQEVGDTVSLTGCLAVDDDDSSEYLLLGVGEEADATDEIELLAAEGVDLATHVGHTVEATGTVVSDDDEEDADDDVDDEDEMDDEADDVHVSVTALSHVAASCD